jgi:SAM-dependent methyltransferase
MDIDQRIVEYYNRGHENDRLTAQPGLELIRTQVLLERFLPGPPARVLEVGGASGVYSSWLAGRGYDVDLIDPVPLHIEQASAVGGFTARLGDARRLDYPDDSFDAVLLLGPIYHLTDRAERVQAFAEAVRVCRSGGVVTAAAISRYASMFDGFFRGFVDRPGFVPLMREDLRTGQHRNPDGTPEFFTTGFFHDRDDLAAEAHEGGLAGVEVLPIEGPLHWAAQIRERLADPRERELILEVLTTIEGDPAMTNATSHLFAVGRVA